MKEKVKYCLDLSDYDYDTAEAMLLSKRFLYVGFMCHQVIEKTIKAYYNSMFDDLAPFSHNLTFLARKSGLYDHLSTE